MSKSWKTTLPPPITPVVRTRRLARRDEADTGDNREASPLRWIQGPAGAGKTALLATYARRWPGACLWYRMDRTDADPMTFVRRFAQAAHSTRASNENRLPKIPPSDDLDGREVPGGNDEQEKGPRRVFTDALTCLGDEALVILDSVQEATAAEGPLLRLLADGLPVVPPNVRVVLASRQAPPPMLAELRLKSRLEVLGWDALRLTERESTELACHLGTGQPNPETLRYLHLRAEGWIAGFISLLRAMERHDPVDPLPEDLADFFEVEVFSQLPEDTRHLLLRTAFLGCLTRESIGELTPQQDACEVFARLWRAHGFTLPDNSRSLPGAAAGATRPRNAAPPGERRPDHHWAAKYRFRHHPLFRSFLADRARRTLAPKELSSVRRKSARVLNQQADIDSAAALHIEERAWSPLAALIKTYAPACEEEGRYRQVGRWVEAMPRQQRHADPWLAYGHGVCTMSTAPTEARTSLETALAGFRERGIRTGGLLAWAAIVNSLLLGFEPFARLDPWIEMHETLLAELGDPFDEASRSAPSPSPSEDRATAEDSGPPGDEAQAQESLETQARVRFSTTLFWALVMRNPGHPRFALWRDRAITLPEPQTDAQGKWLHCWALSFMHHIQHLHVLGHLVEADLATQELREVMRRHRSTPLAAIATCQAEASNATFTVNLDGAHEAMRAGLAIAEESGIHAFDVTLVAPWLWIGAHLEDRATVAAYFSRLEDRLKHGLPWEEGVYRCLRVVDALARAEVNEAEAHAEVLQRVNRSIGSYIGDMINRALQAAVMREIGERERAHELNQKNIEEERRTGGCLFTFDALLNEAALSLDAGDRAQAVATLRRAFTIGSRQRLLFTYAWNVRLMQRLCSVALEEGIETEYVSQIVRTWEMTPLSSHRANIRAKLVRRWPWPVRILTLGEFRVERSGAPLSFGSPSPRKLLEMIKATLALGGSEVDARRIEDALWPEASGDKARKSLEMTTLRLRKLLGNPRYVLLRDGAVTLDPAFCWSDAQAFDQLFNEAKRRWARARRPGATDAPSATRPPANWRPGDAGEPSRCTLSDVVVVCEQAMALYQGAFLPFDRDKPWTAPMRDKLHDRFVHLVLGLTSLYQATRQWSAAVEALRNAIEVTEPRPVEELYQHLMLCYHALGLTSLSHETYQRLRDTLTQQRDAAPSPRTESLREAIRKNTPLSVPRISVDAETFTFAPSSPASAAPTAPTASASASRPMSSEGIEHDVRDQRDSEGAPSIVTAGADGSEDPLSREPLPPLSPLFPL